MRSTTASSTRCSTHPLHRARRWRRGRRVLAALRALDGFDGEIDALPEGTLGLRRPRPAHRRQAVPRRRARRSALHAAPAGAHRPAARQADRDAVAGAHQPHVDGRVEGGARGRRRAGQAGARVRRAPHPSRPPRSTRRTPPSWRASGTSNVAALRRTASRRRAPWIISSCRRPSGRACRWATPSATPSPLPARFPRAATMLVDTYDTERGFATRSRPPGRQARAACGSTPTSRPRRARARALLDELGAPSTQDLRLRRARRVPRARAGGVADGFGVGENITCSPDAARASARSPS